MQAYIAAMPGWKRDAGCRLDALIMSTIPDDEKLFASWIRQASKLQGRVP